MTPEEKARYEAWTDTIANDAFSMDRAEFKTKVLASLIQAHQNGRGSELKALAFHLSQRCGGGEVRMPQVGNPTNEIKEPVKVPDPEKASRKVPTQDMSGIYIKMMSDDENSAVDYIFKIERGGKFSVSFPDEKIGRGFMTFPSSIPPDQRCIVSDSNGMRPRCEKDEFQPPWGYEDEGFGWKPDM